MAATWWRVALYGSRRWRGFSTSAALSRRTAPLGPMPNEVIDVSNLERLKKYRSFDRYRRRAEQEARDPHWWRTYREHFGEESASALNSARYTGASPWPAVNRLEGDPNYNWDGQPPRFPMTETDPKDKIDIGLPAPKVCRTQQLLERKRVLQALRANVEEERAARLRTARIPLEAVRAEWERTCGPYHKQRLAEHYGLYRDLFHGATFVPRVPLHVAYAVGEDDLVPVYYGNEVTPTEAAQAPEVTYKADEGSMWTLLLTNLDGHLLEPDAEYLHWLVTNIPGNRVAEGQETCPYLPPFPARGSGFHRFAFLLFKQDKPIDFSGDTRPSPCYQLAQRTFHTFDFYKKHQDAMTPAGLAFFQCRWDDSVTHIFHQLLDMREPVFEFMRPPPYHPKQKRFPHRQPLRYLDRYRDSHEPTYGIY
ncbi:39S ribosomal protein L38, mitochondrial isoform X1 [Delphinapterus leucas]|uniref:Large ribosomal subunit protein mL38 n=1 Tax=Delphinapterus leucas TaxID=9749 RepID=A0A2Y9PPN0_DELLE|nr:39S ribosomal protein L38, mitochondrial isoform X1 [Delphinapterus leucas]